MMVSTSMPRPELALLFPMQLRPMVFNRLHITSTLSCWPPNWVQVPFTAPMPKCVFMSALFRPQGRCLGCAGSLQSL